MNIVGNPLGQKSQALPAEDLRNTGSNSADQAIAPRDCASHRFYRQYGKRLLDVTLAAVLIPLWVGMSILICGLISLDGGKPLFCQPRIGKDGRTFNMWKLRSMRNDASAHLENLLSTDPIAREEWNRRQKLSNDPRITWVGKFIRSISLDELPQFWNVLRGDMSLVGPRPFLPEQRHQYHGTDYYSVRPGLTGLWQVSVRGESDFTDRVRYDDSYVTSMSLSHDLAILARTVWVVLRANGQ